MKKMVATDEEADEEAPTARRRCEWDTAERRTA